METILWPELKHKRVLLCVSGGIAAYKSAELCRLLIKCGAEVRVMMTTAAQQFVGRTTFAALTGHPVSSDLFDPSQETQIGHIELADISDLLIVAPATANLLGKMAGGIADDLASTVYLAFTGPVLLAPAMNVHMWEHPATQKNLARLLDRPSHHQVGPGEGEMACGHVGAGRLATPEEILQAAGTCLAVQDLRDRRILVTAGPTHEPLDPVRFIGNRSSGRMGYAIAAEAATRGARVTLVSGPTSLPVPLGVKRVPVVTAKEMADAAFERADEQEAVIMSAAVADYRPARRSEYKLKKDNLGESLSLPLERNVDILASLGKRSPRPLLVGFGAEAGGDLEQLAQSKLKAKGCDLLVVNDVLARGAGFEVDTNRVTIYHASGKSELLPLMSKRAVAGRILLWLSDALETRSIHLL